MTGGGSGRGTSRRHGTSHAASNKSRWDGKTARHDALAIDYDRAFKEMCHLAALTATGKAKCVVEGLIETALTLSNGGLTTPDAIARAISTRMRVEPSPEDLSAALSSLLINGRVKREAGMLRLTPAAEQQVRARLDSGRQLTESVRQEFAAMAAGEPELAVLSREAVWDALCGYLRRVFRQHGALAADLIDAGGSWMERGDGSFVEMLEEAAADAGVDAVDALRRAVHDFCSAPSPELRRYMSQMLDATFTFFVLRAPAAAEHYFRDRLAPLSLFLDTNVLFEIFGLHEQQGAAAEMLDLVQQSAFPFKVYVHERSVREFRQTLSACEDRIKARRYTPELSKAALKTVDLPSIDRRFHELNSLSMIDPEAFIARYSDVNILLHDRDIQIWRDDGADVMVKGDLINHYGEFLTANRPDGPKGYNVLDHDMEVWLSIDALRHEADTALDTGALLLTNDTWLYRFDWRELRHGGAGAVVLPAQLMAVLRPFASSRTDFDTRFLASLAVPEFGSASVDFSDTTQRVLSYLATFRDLPSETAARVLRNEMMMSRLQNVSEDSDEFHEQIESAVILENTRLVEESGSLQLELVDTRRQLEEAQRAAAEQKEWLAARVAELSQQLESTRADAAAKIGALNEARSAAVDQAVEGAREREKIAQKLQTQIERSDKLADAVDELTRREEHRSRRACMAAKIVAVLVTVAFVIIIMLLPGWEHWRAITTAPHRRRLQLLFSLVAVACGYIVVGPRRHWWPVFSVFVVAAFIAAISLVGP
jgi:hypothetical protein